MNWVIFRLNKAVPYSPCLSVHADKSVVCCWHMKRSLTIVSRILLCNHMVPTGPLVIYFTLLSLPTTEYRIRSTISSDNLPMMKKADTCVFSVLIPTLLCYKRKKRICHSSIAGLNDRVSIVDRVNIN